MEEKVIDTNVFLRHLLQDIPEQSQLATEFIRDMESGKSTGLVSILVINELIWILEKYYHIKRSAYIPKLVQLLLIDQLKVIEVKKEMIVGVLQAMRRKKVDFTDVYLSQIAKKGQILSFDKDIAKLQNQN